MEQNAVVIDNGTHSIKAGISGEPAPSHEIPNFIARPKYKCVNRSTPADFFTGASAVEKRGVCCLDYPLERGAIRSLGAGEDEGRIWRAMYEQLGVAREDRPVLITDACLNSIENMRSVCEILFDVFHVPAVFFALPPILSLYATGETTGVVLDCGEGLSQCLAMYDGYQINGSIKRIDVGGVDVTRYLARLLRQNGHYSFHTSAELEIVRELKEQTDVMYVARNYAQETSMENRVEVEKHRYRLPDGTDIVVGTERYKAPEVLFTPSLVGFEYPGIAEMVVDSIRSCDVDIRSMLCQNIFLAGGSTLFRDFCHRLLFDVRDGMPANQRVVIKAPHTRKYSAWIGGAILASLRSFGDMLTTAKQYRADGVVDILRKSFV